MTEQAAPPDFADGAPRVCPVDPAGRTVAQVGLKIITLSPLEIHFSQTRIRPGPKHVIQ